MQKLHQKILFLAKVQSYEFLKIWVAIYLVSASLRSVPLESLESRCRRVHGGDMTHVTGEPGRRVHGGDMTHVIGLERRAKHMVFQLTTYQNE